MHDLLRNGLGSAIFAVLATDTPRVWRDTGDAILVLMAELGN